MPRMTVCRIWRVACRGWLAIFLGCLGLTVHAASQRIVDFSYDEAGNLISIISQVQSAPPTVSDLSPGFISPGQVGDKFRC